MTETSIWTYPWDLADEGVGEALETMQKRAGATGFNVAAVYHSGKFLHVHNPKRRVVFPRSGTLYFQPDDSWHGRLRIQPPVWDEVDGFWDNARREADRLGLYLSSTEETSIMSLLANEKIAPRKYDVLELLYREFEVPQTGERS